MKSIFLVLIFSFILSSCSGDFSTTPKTFNAFDHVLISSSLMMPSASIEQTQAYSSFISSVQSPSANVIQFHKDDSGIIEEMKKRKIPFIAFKSSKFDGDFDLFAQENKLIKENLYTAHILFNDKLKESKYEISKADIVIKKVESIKELHDADNVADLSFSSGKGVFKTLLQESIHSDAVFIFIAYKDSLPIGISVLTRNKKQFGIYWVGVIPEMQKQGVGLALVRYAINCAKELGAEEIVSQNNIHSEKIFQKDGFQPMSSLSVYYYMPVE